MAASEGGAAAPLSMRPTRSGTQGTETPRARAGDVTVSTCLGLLSSRVNLRFGVSWRSAGQHAPWAEVVDVRCARWAARRAIAGSALLAITFVAAPAADATTAPSMWVNGFPMHGEGSRKLGGCELTIEVRDLDGTAHDVRVVVRGMEPSGSGVALDEVTATAATDFSTGPREMGALVEAAGLVTKANGYHLRIETFLDGAPLGGAPFWLACGVAQHSGHPWTVPLDARWYETDGVTPAMPAPGPGFAITATSKQGRGVCTYDGSTLVCVYERTSGHGEDEDDGHVGGHGEILGILQHDGGHDPDGVWVSGRGTYTVAVTGVPDGWELDATTVGAFSPREQCPEPAVPPEDEVPQGRTPCPHTVVLRALAAPTTTTTTLPTTTPATVTPATTSLPTSTVPSTGTLPRTGAGPLAALLGLMFVGAGGALLRLAARRWPDPRRDAV